MKVRAASAAARTVDGVVFVHTCALCGQPTSRDPDAVVHLSAIKSPEAHPQMAHYFAHEECLRKALHPSVRQPFETQSVVGRR